MRVNVRYFLKFISYYSAGNWVERFREVKRQNSNKVSMAINPTRVTQLTKSTIDLAIVNNPASKVSNSGVLDLSIADHKTIFVTYKMKTKSPGFSIKRVRNYRGLDEKSLQKDLHDVPWWVTSLFDDIDDVTHAWELLFKDVLDTHIPTRTAKIRKESLPWVTGEIRKEMNKRYKVLRKCDGTSNTSQCLLGRVQKNKKQSD